MLFGYVVCLDRGARVPPSYYIRTVQASQDTGALQVTLIERPSSVAQCAPGTPVCQIQFCAQGQVKSHWLPVEPRKDSVMYDDL